MKEKQTEEQKDILRALELMDDEEDIEHDRRPGRRPGRATGRQSSGRKTGQYILMALGCIALVLLIVLVILILRQKEPASQQAGNMDTVYTQEEVDRLLAKAVESAREEEADRFREVLRENFADGDPTTLALRPLFPNELVIASNGQIRFYPISDALKKNSYLQENLEVLEDGKLQYMEGDLVVSHKGIDVSQHQGEIDWQQVAEDGIEFAFLRVGFRGYGEAGRLVVDEQFENNVKGALANGIKVGVYFYSQSVTVEEALEEASLVLEQIAPYKITGPVVYDAEKLSNSDARTLNLTMEERTAMTKAFCNAVAQAGYRPVVYLNLELALTSLDLAQLEEYDKWLAHYTTEMYYPYDYKIWQYSEKGTVKGINSKVDLDISFEDWE